jgi:Carboxypeptidase regulatory-like domain/TonB-dependent Receptor Plug Domain
MHTCIRKKLLILLVLCAVASFGQGTGSITGTVRDNTGAVVPKAEVTLTDTATLTAFHTTSNAEGEYLVAAIPPGGYDLAVSAVGFNKFESKGIILRVSQRARVDATLSVGEVKTAVTVEGSGVTQVETESSEVSGVVTGKEISQIVLNGRNFTQLITLTPGVSNQTGQDEGTVGVYGNVAFSVNGGRTEYNNWEIDGGDNMDNGSNGTLNVYPNVDAIAEVRVLTSNYGAQYGRNGSGTVETVTKSGTKDFHGDLFEFVRNDAFNARNFFSPNTPPYKKNDYGYTVGGPVWIPGVYNRNKDKTFFFWSEEWRKERLPNTFNVQVPSTQERQGNDLCPGSRRHRCGAAMRSRPWERISSGPASASSPT